MKIEGEQNVLGLKKFYEKKPILHKKEYTYNSELTELNLIFH